MNIKVLFYYVVLCFIFALCISGYSADQKPATPDTTNESHYVIIEMKGMIPDYYSFKSVFGGDSHNGIIDYYNLLNKIADDKDVAGIILKLRNPILGVNKAFELQKLIKSFREKSNKKVYCFSTSYSIDDYLIACASDEIFLPPSGEVDVKGLGAEIMYFKDVLDWLGVKANIVHIGEFKSYGEIFTEKEPTEYFKEEFNTLLDSLYNDIVLSISKERNITVEKSKELIDKGFHYGEETVSAKLVNKILYEDELSTYLSKDNKKARLITNYGKEEQAPKGFADLAKLFYPPEDSKSKNPKIAIVFAQGEIIEGYDEDGFFSDDYVSANEMRNILMNIRKNDTIKGVVIRIDSPGGSALASDIIWREIMITSKTKTVIVSMSSTAASGGYYIAMGGSIVFAMPTTVTGSIGVVGGKFNLKGLYNKIGINKFRFNRGKNALIYSDYNDFTDEEKENVKAQMEKTYKVFLSRITENRNKTVDQIEPYAKGRIWSGKEALKIGLVDKLGTIADAIECVLDKTSLKGNKSVEYLYYPKSKGLMDFLKSTFRLSSNVSIEDILSMYLKSKYSGLIPFSKNIIQKYLDEKVLLRMPYEINMK